MALNIEIPMEDGYIVCVICYEKIGSLNDKGERERPVQLECHHVFGNICLDFWLTTKSRCPICRASVEGYESGSSDESDGSGSELSGSSEVDHDNSESDDSDSDDEMDDNSDDQPSDDEHQGRDDESQASEGSHISISSDGPAHRETSHISISDDDSLDGDAGDELSDDAVSLDEHDMDRPSPPPSRQVSAHEAINRIASHSIATTLMTGLASGVFSLATIVNTGSTMQDESPDDSPVEDNSTDES